MNAFKSTSWRHLRSLVMHLPVLAMVACSDGTGAQPYVGVYEMTQFAGQELPGGDGTIFIRSASIDLRSGGRFELEMDRDFNGEDGWQPDPVLHSGDYTVSGGFLTMNTEEGPLTGAIFPTYIRLNDGNEPSIWEKRE